MGTEITPDMAQKMGLPQVALQQLISRTALDNEAVRGWASPRPMRELTPECARHVGLPAGPLGTFDRPTFHAALQTAQYSEAPVPHEVRQDLTRDQLTQAMEAKFSWRPAMSWRSYSCSVKNAPSIM